MGNTSYKIVKENGDYPFSFTMLPIDDTIWFDIYNGAVCDDTSHLASLSEEDIEYLIKLFNKAKDLRNKLKND